MSEKRDDERPSDENIVKLLIYYFERFDEKLSHVDEKLSGFQAENAKKNADLYKKYHELNQKLTVSHNVLNRRVEIIGIKSGFYALIIGSIATFSVNAVTWFENVKKFFNNLN